MEIRLRSGVSRTAKGYSVEATLDMGGPTDRNLPAVGLMQPEEAATLVDAMSAFQIQKLREHMKALGEAFPRED